MLPFDGDVPYFFQPLYDDDRFELPQPITLRQLATEYLDFMSIPR